MTNTNVDTDWLRAAAGARPHSVAVIDDDGSRFTYAELDAHAAAIAEQIGTADTDRGLIRLVEIGDVDYQTIVNLWACWRSGVVPLVVDRDSPLPAKSPGLLESWLTCSAPGTHTVVLTSGSSGTPRPVRLSHGNVSAAVAASNELLGNNAEDRWLLTMPAFHIGGLSILWRSAAVAGTVVLHSKFDEARVAAAFRSGAVTMASLVPTMLYRLLEFDPGPYQGLKAILVGGAAARRELLERSLESGLPVLQTYGMTEAASQVATVVPGETVTSLGTVGRPLRGVSITTGVAGVGEIVIDGPTVFPGYLGEPDRVGGHPTGDIGYLDENGRLVVLGRVDDMIVTGGENVYPQSVADLLSSAPLLREVEVVAVPDPEWGQSLVAIAVADGAGRDQIETWAREWLPRHEIPKRWIFVAELPMLPNGKVDRSALADIARSDT